MSTELKVRQPKNKYKNVTLPPGIEEALVQDTGEVSENSEALVQEQKERKRKTADPNPQPRHDGETRATYRKTSKLTPLRHNYAAVVLNENDKSFIFEVVMLGGEEGKFSRRNLDAGRLGRLYTFRMVNYDETGISDPEQIIEVTENAYEFVKPVRAA